MTGDAATASGSAPTHPHATQDEDGRWLGSDGQPLPVSASDLERFTYCPLSWHLAATGTSGKSDAIEQGREDHLAIHESIARLQDHQHATKRSLMIWQWWYAVIVVLLIDTIAVQYIDDLGLNILDFSSGLAAGALAFLLVGIAAVLLPWRKTIGLDEPFRPELNGRRETIDPVFEPRGFMGGWLQGGVLEVSMFVSAIVLALHSIALLFAQNREQAAYILGLTTIGWTLLASAVLRRALKNLEQAGDIAQTNDLSVHDEVSYSDDEKTASLLIDGTTGLRGRPDQIVIIDSEFIPVEQKTGKVPKRPHDSHRLQALAYARLVETTTGRAPPYALLRYGPENLHKLPWNDEAKDELNAQIKAVQRAMGEGGARRNHERPGKCQNCSRRHACNDSLV